MKTRLYLGPIWDVPSDITLDWLAVMKVVLELDYRQSRTRRHRERPDALP